MKAAAALKQIKEPITDVKSITNLPFIGKGMAEKIDEFLKTGTIK